MSRPLQHEGAFFIISRLKDVISKRVLPFVRHIPIQLLPFHGPAQNISDGLVCLNIFIECYSLYYRDCRQVKTAAPSLFDTPVPRIRQRRFADGKKGRRIPLPLYVVSAGCPATRIKASFKAPHHVTCTGAVTHSAASRAGKIVNKAFQHYSVCSCHTYRM